MTLGIMLGKAVKLAEGHLDTHSHKVTLNRAFLSQLATEAGCSDVARAVIGRIALARELWSALDAADRDRLLQRVADICRKVCTPLLPEGEIEVLLIAETGEIAYRS